MRILSIGIVRASYDSCNNATARVHMRWRAEVSRLMVPVAAPAARRASWYWRIWNEGLVVGRPVRHAILRLVPGMNLRLHPRSVAPAEGPEKCGPRRPTRSGYSCNNASYSIGR